MVVSIVVWLRRLRRRRTLGRRRIKGSERLQCRLVSECKTLRYHDRAGVGFCHGINCFSRVLGEHQYEILPLLGSSSAQLATRILEICGLHHTMPLLRPVMLSPIMAGGAPIGAPPIGEGEGGGTGSGDALA